MRLIILLSFLLPYALLAFLKGHAFWAANGFEKGRDTFYWTESAMHLYLTEKVAKGESATGLDTRAQFPEGLDLSHDITMGMPLVIGHLYRILAPDMSLAEFAGQFQIYFSALTAIAVSLIALQIYRSKGVALLTGLLYSVATAASARSAGAYLYEDFSLPLIVFGFYFLLSGLDRREAWRTVLAGLLMSAALVSWHLTQFVLLTASIAFATIAFARSSFDREQGRLFAIFAGLLFIAGLASPLLRADGVFVSPAVALFVTIPVYLLFPSSRRALRAAVCALLVLAFLIAYARLGLKDESHVFSIFLEKLKFGLAKPEDPSKLSFEARAMWIEDDNSPNLYSLIYVASFYLPLGIVAMMRSAREQWKKVDPAQAFTLLMSMGFLILYFMARRLLSVEIIFLCLMVGSLAVWRNAFAQRLAVAILLAGIALEGIKTYGFGSENALDRWANGLPKPPADPTLTTLGDHQDIIDWVKAQTLKEDPILTAIGLSPVLLARTHRPIVLHSKFEAHGLRDKFERFLKSLFSSEEDFYSFFKQSGAKYFIYESKTVLFDKADSYRYMANRLTLDENSAAYLMHFRPQTLKRFELIYQNPGYRIFREKTTTPPPEIPQINIYDEGAFKTWGAQEVYSAFFRARAGQSQGFALAQQRRFREAAQVWLEVLKLQPGLPDVNSYLCLAHIALEDYVSAKAECEAELKYRPHSRLARDHMGLWFERNGDTEKAKSFHRPAQ